jgi:Icc-related predicted phosphoesterase
MGFNDQVNGNGEPLGCYDLNQRVLDIKPKLHCFGHIHSGYGIVPEDSTKFINTSVLNESYEYTQKPITLKL